MKPTITLSQRRAMVKAGSMGFYFHTASPTAVMVAKELRREQSPSIPGLTQIICEFRQITRRGKILA